MFALISHYSVIVAATGTPEAQQNQLLCFGLEALYFLVFAAISCLLDINAAEFFQGTFCFKTGRVFR